MQSMTSRTTTTRRCIPAGVDGFGDVAQDVAFRRQTLHDTGSLLIEDSALPFSQALGRDWSPSDQFAFPYFGVFRWRVGPLERLIDANVTLRVRGGEEFHETHPIKGIGHASAIFTPAASLLDELYAQSKRNGGDEMPTVAPMDDRVRLMVHDIVFNPASSLLQRDETAIELMANAMKSPAGQSLRTSRLIERAKGILHERFSEPVSLEQIATELCVTPVYLTQAFRRQEGLPLYRYQTRLRLNRALLMLPDCHSITGLALDLGYSSHAHFTSMFSSTFHLTPREYRAARRGDRSFDWPPLANAS